MLYPDTDPRDWARLYEVEPIERPCRQCGKIQLVSIPFADGSLRGFTALLHECGEAYRAYVYRDINPAEARLWNSFCASIDLDPT